jgi:hypothetical protein
VVVVDVLVVDVEVVDVDVLVVDVELLVVVLEGRVVVVLELLVVELDDVVEVSDVGTVVLGVVPLSSELARRKMATPPASTRTNSTITAMPSGDDQGDLDGAGSGPTAGVASAA